MNNFIFDWGGTISDSLPNIMKVYEKMFEDLDVYFERQTKTKITKRKVKRHSDIPYMKFWNHFYPALTKQKQDELFVKHQHFMFEDEIPKPIPGMIDAIKYLYEKGALLYIVSSDLTESLSRTMKHYKLEKYFKDIYPEIHLKDKKLNQMQVNNKLNLKNTFYVGDTSGDVLLAKKAGLKTIGVTWGYQNADLVKGAKPDYLFHKPNEFKKHF